MSTERNGRTRPYWHVDAKWVTAMILTVLLSLALLAYNLTRITAKEPAVDAISSALVVVLAGQDLDDPGALESMKQQIRTSPNRRIQLIPGLRITLSEDEIEGLSPREAAQVVMGKLAAPVYERGAEGLAELADNPEMRAQILEGGGLLNVLTLQTHEMLRRASRLLAVACGLLLTPLVLFSYRLGRLGSVGVVLFLASLPGLVLFGPLSSPEKQRGRRRRGRRGCWPWRATWPVKSDRRWPRLPSART